MEKILLICGAVLRYKFKIYLTSQVTVMQLSIEIDFNSKQLDRPIYQKHHIKNPNIQFDVYIYFIQCKITEFDTKSGAYLDT